MLVSQEVDALYGGVSQQAPAMRSKEQLSALENGWESLADGTGKRAPTEHIAQITALDPTNVYIHEINRDVTERYIVVASPGSIRVFDLAGNEKTVSAPAGASYLDGITDFTTDVSMTTVADYTFVVNRRKVVQMAPIGRDEAAQDSLNVWLNGSYFTDASGTQYAPGAAVQYAANKPLGTFMGVKQNFAKLPATNVEGEVFQIGGDDTTSFVTYYVQYSGGVYNECRAPNLINAFDENTMPWALIRQGDGSFLFVPFSWAPRRVGDYDTNPNPKFVGRTIRKVLFYQNRLVLLNGENATMSTTGDFGNFYRSTVLDTIDSDPIDVSAATTKVSDLYDAVPFNDGIMLTSDQMQFSLTNGQFGISSSSISIQPVTSFEINYKAGMAAIGTEVYFASERNGWAILREYTRDPTTDALSASEVTAHVPRYIPAGVRQLVGAGDMNALFTITAGDPSAVYVYQFYWASSTEKAQSAHHRWTVGTGATVLSAVYLSGYLYLCVARSDGVYLERINLVVGAQPASASMPIYLDRRLEITGSYDAGTQRTSFDLPYAPDQANFRLVRGTAAGDTANTLVDPTSYRWDASHLVSVPGDEASGHYVLGVSYTFKLTFSPVFYRKYYNGEAVTTGRLQLRTWKVIYSQAAYFRTVVNPYGDSSVVNIGEVIPSKVSDFSGKVIGSSDLILNQPVLSSGGYSFQVYGDARLATISILNDSHVGATFQSAAFEALYWNRAQAI